MRVSWITLAAVSLLAIIPAYPGPDSKSQATQTGKSPMEFDCPGRSQVRLNVRSGEIHVVGSDDARISVVLSGKNEDKIQDVKARLSCGQSVAELNVSGGPKSELIITIHVPRTVNLYVRVPAGQVDVEGITGNKDVEMHAGDLTISVGNPGDYGHVDASVSAGELDAEAFGQEKGGLFRSISKEGKGSYHLHAHVGSGQLTLR